MVVHWFECKISCFLAGLPVKMGQTTTQFLVTVAAVLKKPMKFHLEVFDNWKSGVVPEMDDQESTSFYL